MPTGIRNLMLFVILIAGAAITWLLRPDESTSDSGIGTNGSERGFYILDAVFSGLDDSGAIVYRLAAARIEGSRDPEQMQFHEVSIRYAQERDVPWLITAESARRRPDAEILELTDVVIESTESETATRIEATTLELEPQAQLASTSGPVSFQIGENRIDAMGLTADLRNERISLESGIRGRVTP